MTKVSDAIEATKRVSDSELDKLRGGQLHLSKLKERIERELEVWRSEQPTTRRESTRHEYQKAQARSTEISNALSRSRRKLELHTTKFHRDMALNDVPVWVRDNAQIVSEVTAYSDLLRLNEFYVEHCRTQAEDALHKPDQNRLRILRRVATLKAEFESLNWNASQTKRGEEILIELRELQKQMNLVIVDE